MNVQEEIAVVKKDIAETQGKIEKAEAEQNNEKWNKLMDYLTELQKKENILSEQNKSGGNHCFYLID